MGLGPGGRLNNHHPERQTDTPNPGALFPFLLPRIPKESFPF